MGYFEEIQTEKVTLPSNNEFWVEVKSDILFGDLVRMGAVSKDGTPDLVASSENALLQAIVDWNLTDNDGNKVDINLENVRKLKGVDSMALVNKIKNLDIETPEEKKIS